MEEFVRGFVVGASFAGLAVASRLRGRVLLVDRHEVGEVQTSACGTPLWVPQGLGVADSVLQIHHRAVVHAPTQTVVYDLANVPYCTFDYRRFCRGLLDQTDACFLRAPVTGLRNGVVETEAGQFQARCVIDCPGWRGVLTAGADGGTRAPMSFGLETRTDYQGEALYFWAAPDDARHIVSWIFPVGEASRVGVGSYTGKSKLRQPLDRFMDGLGLAPGRYHGTYFPAGLRAPTMGSVFAAGDAGGHCVPLTAEGIRPAIYFGDRCGRTVQDVLDGRVTLEEGLREYRRFVLTHRVAYAWLRCAQVGGTARARWMAGSDG
jgi:menaquinone-9 beta-reductase